jgi:hypothetical protein
MRIVPALLTGTIRWAGISRQGGAGWHDFDLKRAIV